MTRSHSKNTYEKREYFTPGLSRVNPIPILSTTTQGWVLGLFSQASAVQCWQSWLQRSKNKPDNWALFLVFLGWWLQVALGQNPGDQHRRLALSMESPPCRTWAGHLMFSASVMCNMGQARCWKDCEAMTGNTLVYYLLKVTFLRTTTLDWENTLYG